MKIVWQTISYCPPIKTVHTFSTKEEAIKARERIDGDACGGRCLGKNYHHVRQVLP